jgi:serine/threonine-protein kinase RsbW
VDLEQHIAERRTGGLGVHLMHAMMDAVDYRREDGQNVLVLTKKAARA